MSNKVTLQVGVDDQTQAGNASIVAGAESTRKTLDQQHREMLATHNAEQLKFAQENADALLNVDHQLNQRRAAELAAMMERHAAAQAKLLEPPKPLNEKQQAAVDHAKTLLQNAPPPVVQKVINDIQPVTQAVEADTAGRDAAMKEALRLNGQLTKAVNELAAAERVLHQDPSTQFSESELARLRFIEKQLRDSQLAAFALAKSFREVGDSIPGGQEFHQMADAIERDAIDSEASLTSLTAKIDEVNQHHASIAVKTEGVEKTLGEFRKVSEEAVTAAAKASKLWAEGDNAEQMAADVRKAAEAIRASGDESTGARTKLASLTAEADRLDEASAEFRRLADAEEEVSRTALRAAGSFTELASEEGKAGQEAAQLAAQNQRVADSLNSAAHARHREELARMAAQYREAGSTVRDLQRDMDNERLATQRLGQEFGRMPANGSAAAKSLQGVGASGRNAGQGIMQLAYAADDMQYGLRGIVNNIPGLLQGLGLGAGLAGVISIVAVALNQLEQHFGIFTKMGEYIKSPKKAVDDLAGAYGGLEQALLQVRIAAGGSGAEVAEGNLKKEQKLAEERKKNAEKQVAQTTVAAAEKERSEGLTKQADEQRLARIKTIEDAEKQLAQANESIRMAQTGQSSMSADQLKRQIEFRDATEKKLHDLQFQRENEIAEKRKTDHDAELSRVEAERQKKITTLAEVAAEEQRIATLRKGRSTGEVGAKDLTKEQSLRLDEVEKANLAKKSSLIADLQKVSEDNARSYAAENEKIVARSAELDKQIALSNELNEIQDRAKAAINDPQAAADRANAERQRRFDLDGIKETTDAAKAASDRAQSDASLNDDQKKVARRKYTETVLAQVNAEAEANRAALRDQIQQQREAEKIERKAAEETLAVRQRDYVASVKAVAEARLAQQEAEALIDDKHDERKKRAASDLAKAQADQSKALEAVKKQANDNESQRKRTQAENDNANAAKRLKDEQDIGLEKQKALRDADILDRKLAADKEADRRKRLQEGLQVDPKFQQAAQRVAGNIREKDVVKRAEKNAQNRAEKQFVAQRQREGKPVKPKDVKAVRGKALADFRKELGRGQADGQLAEARNGFFQKLVDEAQQRRKIDRDTANALRAMANKFVQEAKEKEAVGDRAENLEQQNFGDKKQKPQKPRAQLADEPDAEFDVVVKDGPGFKPAPAKPIDPDKEAKKQKAKAEADDKKRKADEEKERQRKEEEWLNSPEYAAEQEKQRKAVDANLADIERKRQQGKTGTVEEANDDRDAIGDNQPDPPQQQPDALNGAGGGDTIAMPVEIDDADAKAELDDLTQPREVVVTARVEQRDDIAGQQVVDRVTVEQEDRQPLNRQREPIQWEPESNASTGQPQQDPSAAALKTAESAMAKMANAQAQANAEVVAALGSLTKLVTDQANRHVALHDVVAQITGHINNTSAQFAREDNSARLRAISSAGV